MQEFSQKIQKEQRLKSALEAKAEKLRKAGSDKKVQEAEAELQKVQAKIDYEK